jgi:hypothetical protein
MATRNSTSGHALALINCRAPKSSVRFIANDVKGFLAREVPAPILDSLVLEVNQGTTCITRGSRFEAKEKLRQFIRDAEADGAIFLTPGPKTFHLTQREPYGAVLPNPLVVVHSKKGRFYQPPDGRKPPGAFVFADSDPLVRLSIAVRRELFDGTHTVVIQHDFGNLYVITGTMPGATNEQVAGELVGMVNMMYHPALYENGEPFRGVIAYERGGDYFVYKNK